MLLLVKIPQFTRNTHTVNGSMVKMQGKQHRIEDIQTTKYGKAAIIGDYYWHPNDLTELGGKKEPNNFHFDVKELVT